MADHARLVAALLERHGRRFAEEMGIDLPSGGRDAMFQWLVASLLCSARISGALAIRAARAVVTEGLGTLDGMERAGWDGRVRILNASGYARFDEKTATLLGDLCATLRDRWDGDLRNLRAAARGDGAEIRRRIQDFKGIGPVGAGIFAREAQDPWPELRPFADRLALDGAAALGLPDRAEDLADLVPPEAFTTLLAALTRTRLAKDAAAIRAAAEADRG